MNVVEQAADVIDWHRGNVITASEGLQIAQQLADAGLLIAEDPKERPTTTNLCDNQADACRARGWFPGTLLAGDEGYGETVIEITGLGESRVMARVVSHDGKPQPWRSESSWTLGCRAWRKIGVAS